MATVIVAEGMHALWSANRVATAIGISTLAAVLAVWGYEDWCMDDQPVWLTTRTGGLLSVPYSQEINDSSTIVGRQSSATDFAAMIIDQFDEMRETPGSEPLVMSVILHSFISGQPFRLRALRRAVKHIVQHAGTVWMTRPGDIAQQYARQVPYEPYPVIR